MLVRVVPYHDDERVAGTQWLMAEESGHCRIGQVALAQSAPAAGRRRWLMHDPLAGSSWSIPATVAGFARSESNDTLMRFAEAERDGRRRHRARHRLRRRTQRRAARAPRLACRRHRPLVADAVGGRATARATKACGVSLALAPMDALPVRAGSFDLVVAHGIWNLARSAAELRRAVAEAARVAAPGAALFVFTFSRNTLPPDAPSGPRRAVHVHAVLRPAAVLPDA